MAGTRYTSRLFIIPTLLSRFEYHFQNKTSVILESNIGDEVVILSLSMPSIAGLGRVLDKSTRVQVQVLEKMTSTSTSTSTGFLKVLEYKYKYFEKYSSTSTEYFGYKL